MWIMTHVANGQWNGPLGNQGEADIRTHRGRWVLGGEVLLQGNSIAKGS